MQNDNLSHIVTNDIDKDIFYYIECNENEDFSEVLKNDERWEVFYHLSPMRTAIVDWYDFKEGADILEVGGGFGAITGRLCDKGQHVTVVEKNGYRARAIAKRYSNRGNLSVLTGDALELSYEKKYDYVVLNGILGTIGEGTNDIIVYSEFLKKLALLLKEQGRILFSIDNRLGVKYFCGVKEKYSKVPFMGINGYPEKARGYIFSKYEIEQILKTAHVEEYKLYYPMPDYVVTQVVYSDNYLPESNINERIMTYYPERESLLIAENVLYKDLVENNAFTFMANSFLVECCYNCRKSDIDFATITTDRGPVHGQVTAIYQKETVKKYAVSQEGNCVTKLCYDNICDIAARNIEIVPHTYTNHVLSMPYINGQPLSEQIGRIAKERPDELVEIFDLLYKNILQSSEHVNTELNRMYTTVSVPDIGVILEKAYIDMIPFNCFYINGKCIYFDQEFVRDYYPAKYVMFRALMYSYLHNPAIENRVSLNKMKKRYGLESLWDFFREEEKKFVSENRNRNQYSQFYKWATIKHEEIFKRDKKLRMLNASMNSNYAKVDGIKLNISNEKYEKLKSIQGVQKKLLKKVIEICESNKLAYFAYYGTLLGAVRHQDMIPWDDDVDIVMPREDYTRFLSIVKKMQDSDIFLQTVDSDRECFYGGYAKLRASNTTAIELRNWGSDCNQGIWIDIMPLDRVFSNKLLYTMHLNAVMLFQKLMYAKVYGDKEHALEYIPGLPKISKICLRIIKYVSYESLSTCLNRVICLANDFSMLQKNCRVGVLARYMKKASKYQVVDESIFETYKEQRFGELFIRVPEDEVMCLRRTEGRNYLELPDIELRKPHHACFYDVNTSWRVYCGRFKNILQGAEHKKIIIVGSGIWFESYMELFGKEYVPELLVETNDKYWGAKKYQYKIKRPCEILKVSAEDRHIIICDKMFRKSERKLQELGIKDYHIYVCELKWVLQNS